MRDERESLFTNFPLQSFIVFDQLSQRPYNVPDPPPHACHFAFVVSTLSRSVRLLRCCLERQDASSLLLVTRSLGLFHTLPHSTFFHSPVHRSIPLIAQIQPSDVALKYPVSRSTFNRIFHGN